MLLSERRDVKCQLCSNPATVHLTSIVEGHKSEQHLCQQCAEQQQTIQNQELNLPAILHSLIGQHVGQLSDELARLVCPACGIKYMEFRAEGRLGCPHDYTVFRAGLEPLLQRIHRAERHVGKRPHNYAGESSTLVELRQRLRQAVESEAFEEAARLRDLLRQKESSNEPG
jgi:protein arginine kinase activator